MENQHFATTTEKTGSNKYYQQMINLESNFDKEQDILHGLKLCPRRLLINDKEEKIAIIEWRNQ